jgi:hypothetical protein
MLIPVGPMDRQIRISGVLLVIGLIIEAISLAWAHPTAFIVFFVFGGLSMAAGMLLFLYSVVSNEGKSA